MSARDMPICQKPVKTLHETGGVTRKWEDVMPGVWVSSQYLSHFLAKRKWAGVSSILASKTLKIATKYNFLILSETDTIWGEKFIDQAVHSIYLAVC